MLTQSRDVKFLEMLRSGGGNCISPIFLLQKKNEIWDIEEIKYVIFTFLSSQIGIYMKFKDKTVFSDVQNFLRYYLVLDMFSK